MDKIKRKVVELDEFAEEIRAIVDDLASERDMSVGYVIVLTCQTDTGRWARETITNIAPDQTKELLKSSIKVISLAESTIKPPTTQIH